MTEGRDSAHDIGSEDGKAKKLAGTVALKVKMKFTKFSFLAKMKKLPTKPMKIRYHSNLSKLELTVVARDSN